ncbi:DNA-processing protein DprA [Gorillibacterium massiliense]|uniref:DNA-processing protein DprA n=1 Tax=Gorillibacterium massiliense TaxID=1280390 RepID=UPI0004AE5661|nr:DNA-processing protein DprA [Gorillibacterium massiliense]
MNQRSVLLALQEIKGVGWKTILRLAATLESLAELLHMDGKTIADLGIPQDKAEAIAAGLRTLTETGKGIDEREIMYRNRGIIPVTIYDEAYPERLRESSQPPWVLYAIGKVDLLVSPSVAIVGTRTPTVYGRKVSEDLGRALSRAGCCVVSGLARGIDAAAHEGALTGPGGTVAVKGGGPDRIYPAENTALYRAIAQKGLIVSEFPPGTAAVPGMFPLRNRIIAGLTLGTVVVEAAVKSGSLITADQALDESRDVFAIPGPITSPKSGGTHHLLKQGAKLVTEPGDILREYQILFPDFTDSLFEQEKESNLTAEEEEILRFLSHEPVSIDRLLSETRTNFGHLHNILLHLVLKKRIKAMPGAAYVKI